MKEQIPWRVVHIFVTVLLALHVAETFQARTLNDDTKGSSHYRRKRQTSCDAKYREITPGHTACLPPSKDFVAENSGLKNGDKEIIVDIHNTVRREVSPAATNMMKMSWDDEIANTAQRWAENCNIKHDSNYKRYAFGRFSVGQNLAWGSWAMGWTHAIKLWADEKKDYSYSSNNSPTGAAIGHYTQMVWATSIKVGCGYAICGTTHYYVCNYGPGGNMRGERPYKSGSTCEDCPNNCNNGLCDCGGKVCLNGGDMDLNTCKCTCKNNLEFYIEPVCGLNCTDIKDPYYCNQFGISGCERYSNVPQECPDMCKWCPTAAYKRTDVSTGSRAMCSVVGIVTSLLLLIIV